jgi:cytochrome c oxidase cbb3-type subunit III
MRCCRISHIIAAASLAALLSGCRDDGPRHVPPETAGRALSTAVGDFYAGPMDPAAPSHNPVGDGDRARTEGERWYGWFNCAGCHGGAGGGGIGPPFADDQWIYGDSPAAIFQSIAQGRPNGMPAFGGRVQDEQIWQIVAYVRSLSPTSGQQSQGGRGDRQ